PPSKQEASLFYRYAVHQDLQSYFFHRIGAPFFELGNSRLFTVSLLPSHGKQLPAPQRTAFEFLLTLIRTLINHPSSAPRSQAARGEVARCQAVWCVRAAVRGLLSAFCIAVVRRFAGFSHGSIRSPRRFGSLEDSRLVLRWMIFQSGWRADQEGSGA